MYVCMYSTLSTECIQRINCIQLALVQPRRAGEAVEDEPVPALRALDGLLDDARRGGLDATFHFTLFCSGPNTVQLMTGSVSVNKPI